MVLDAAFQEEGKGVVVTLTDRDSTPTLLKTMAIKYRGAYTFVEVPPSETEFLGKFGVAKEDLSQLFVLPASKVRVCACVCMCVERDGCLHGRPTW